MNMCNMWKYLFIQSRNQNIPAERSVNQHITLSMRFSYYFVDFCNPNNKVDIIYVKVFKLPGSFVELISNINPEPQQTAR